MYTNVRTEVTLALAALTLAVIGSLLSGCIAEGEPPPCDDTALSRPSAVSATHPVPNVKPILRLLFGGPPAGQVVEAAADNANVLCFSLEASKNIDIWKLRLRLETVYADDPVGGGLVNGTGNVPNYTDIKVVRGDIGQVYFGPSELLANGNDTVQTLVFTDVIGFSAGTPVSLCVQIDVRGDNASMDSDRIRVSLLPFEPGDVRYANGNDLPVGLIAPQTALSTTFTVTACNVCEVRNNETLLDDIRPWVSPATLPVTTMANRKIVHGRINITAGSEDVMIRQLTFAVRYSGVTPDLDTTVRELGTAASFDRTVDMHCEGEPSVYLECIITIAFREDVVVPAWNSKGYDIVTTVTNVSSGDWIETSFVSDGALVGSCTLEDDGSTYGIDGTTPAIIWTDALGANRSGAGITPFGPMTVSAP